MVERISVTKNIPSIIGEIWKNVPGYEGTYWVSTFGRVWSEIRRWNGRVFCKSCGRIMQTSGSMYPQVTLCRDGTSRNCRVHALVWFTFVGEVPNGLEINHKNGNKEDSRLDNLELVTRKNNVIHAFQHELMKVKLSKDQVLEIRRLYRSGSYFQRQLAKRFGVSLDMIHKILTRKSWGHI